MTKKKIEYEYMEFGPFRAKRIGRHIELYSEWKPGEHKKFLDHLKRSRPKLKKDVDSQVTELLAVISENDPIDLLTVVSINNCFSDPEEHRESTHKGKECYIEYALSAVTSQPYDVKKEPASKEALDRFSSLIDGIFGTVTAYHGIEYSEGKDDIDTAWMRFGILQRYLYVRGESYSEHHTEIVRDIYSPHDEALVKYAGFTTDQLIRGTEEIRRQIQESVKKKKAFFKILHEMHELYKNFYDSEDMSKYRNKAELLKGYRAFPGVMEKQRELDKHGDDYEKNPFQVVPNDNLPMTLLDGLCTNMGENVRFLAHKPTLAWPANDSIIQDKPILRHDDRYYVFLPQLLFRNMGSILDNIIKNSDKGYYDSSFQKKKSDFLGSKTIEYLVNIMPDAISYEKLSYRYTDEEGEEQDGETDGLVLFDDNIFIVEAKAGLLSVSAKRGGMDRLKRGVKDLISDSFSQALRTKNYINLAPTPTFYNDNGDIVLEMVDKHNYRNIYMISSILQHLGELSCHLHSVRELGLLEGREWPWVVYINDLKVISEIVESPSLFLLYLQRRIRANDFHQFRESDELGIFMYFLHEGLYFENDKSVKHEMISPSGYTEDLDHYYDYIAGRVASGKKPKLRILNDYRKLVQKIENSQKPKAIRLATWLYGLDGRDQKIILDNLRERIDSVKGGAEQRDFQLHHNGIKTALMFHVVGNRGDRYWESRGQYCELKLYQTKLEEWILISVEIQANGSRDYDFRIYEKKWQYDEEMEAKVERFRKVKAAKAENVSGAIGRNDPCPCNSGKKYKKCCGR